MMNEGSVILMWAMFITVMPFVRYIGYILNPAMLFTNKIIQKTSSIGESALSFLGFLEE